LSRCLSLTGRLALSIGFVPPLPLSDPFVLFPRTFAPVIMNVSFPDQLVIVSLTAFVWIGFPHLFS